jgi:hypothetical protein
MRIAAGGLGLAMTEQMLYLIQRSAIVDGQGRKRVAKIMDFEVADADLFQHPVEGFLRIVQRLAVDFTKKYKRIARDFRPLFQQFNGHRVKAIVSGEGDSGQGVIDTVGFCKLAERCFRYKSQIRRQSNVPVRASTLLCYFILKCFGLSFFNLKMIAIKALTGLSS